MNSRTDQDTLFGDNHAAEHTRLREELKQVHSERSALNDRYMRLLKEQNLRENHVREAAERRAREAALDLIHRALGDTLATAARLAHAVVALPEQPAASALLKLHALAEDLAGQDLDARPDVAALRAIEQHAQTQIDHWKGRALNCLNLAARNRAEIIADDDTYADLVAAGWKAPAYRIAQHRAQAKAEGAAYSEPNPAVPA